MQNETRVVLSEPLRYSGRDGEFHSATFIVIKAPSSSAYKPAIQIKQLILRALAAERRAAQDAPEVARPEVGEDVRPTGSDWIAMLSASDADMPRLFELVRDLLLKFKLALADGEVPMTVALFDDLRIPDLEAIVGEYVATFTLAT